MREVLWARRPRPASTPGASTVGQWQPTTLAELTAHRLELAAALHDGRRPPGADDAAVERLLLTFEELVSNALRHGSAPVTVAVTATGSYWLLEVSDAAPTRPPTPAVGRDAARGGLVRYLVARICDAHGWTVDGNRKLVWARIDYVRVEAPAFVPGPRKPVAGDSHAQ